VDERQLTPFEAFDLAVTRAGSQSELARICGCTPANIGQLLQKRSQLPGEYVLPVERATGVSRHDLRPDLYPRGLQDGVPFTPEAGNAALGELGAAGTPEWPLSPRDDEHACDPKSELQRPAA
jgi:DNA-binding transcriptional regulator YdaS (Cro superfamily)